MPLSYSQKKGKVLSVPFILKVWLRGFFDLIVGRCDQDSPQRHGVGEETQGQQPGGRTAHRVPQGNPASLEKW